MAKKKLILQIVKIIADSILIFEQSIKFLNSGSALWSFFRKLLLIILILATFLVAIDLMVVSLSYLGTGIVQDMIAAAEAPFIALFIGLLATAIIQSSSTITSIAVAMVASQSLSLSSGIYLVMGANIGTTITSDIVSLGFITKRSAFRRAISAATIHDFFNFFTTLIIFPLEYNYRFLSKAAVTISSTIHSPAEEISPDQPISGNLIIRPITQLINQLGLSNWLLLIVSVILIFLSIKMFAGFSLKLFIGDSKDKLQKYIFDKAGKSFTWGMLFTGTIQSSSISSSLVVPLVALRKVSLESVFPFLLGANVGTTITALIAALFKSETALSLALAHLIFNAVGVLIVLPFPKVRRLFVIAASEFGKRAGEKRLIGFFYIIFAFFLIPFLLIYLSG